MPSRPLSENSAPNEDPLSYESRINAMLTVEAALAQALEKAGIIPQAYVDAMAAACSSEAFDAEALRKAGQQSGTEVVPLVKEIVARTKSISEEASRFVHYGSTSQDILDTATVLQLKNTLPCILVPLAQIETALSALARTHANTPVLGRTLLQAGPPISFGLKVAGWMAAIRRGRTRLEQSAKAALCLQFGGAVGNLSSLGADGLEVAKHLASELDLPLPEAPWHTHRDRLANLAASMGILIGSLGKIARDLSLHMQGEVAELKEPTAPGKGGSSAMPHKRNPVGCLRILAASNRAPALVSALLSAMPQEHERGLGGWQSEWPSLKELFAAGIDSSDALAEIAEGLEVDAERMRSNLDATNEVVFSERLSTALLPQIGRVESQELVARLVTQSIEQGQLLSLVAAEDASVNAALDADELKNVFDISKALGSSPELMDRLLNEEGS